MDLVVISVYIYIGPRQHFILYVLCMIHYVCVEMQALQSPIDCGLIATWSAEYGPSGDNILWHYSAYDRRDLWQ